MVFHRAQGTEGSLYLLTLPCLDKKDAKELMDAMCFHRSITHVAVTYVHCTLSSFLHYVLLCVLLY